jgi:hypothetical protein
VLILGAVVIMSRVVLPAVKRHVHWQGCYVNIRKKYIHKELTEFPDGLCPFPSWPRVSSENLFHAEQRISPREYTGWKNDTA